MAVVLTLNDGIIMSGFNVSSSQSLMLLDTLTQMLPVTQADNSTQTSTFFSSTAATTSAAKDSFGTAGSVALTLALACVVTCLFYTLCRVCADEFHDDAQVSTVEADDPDYADALTDADELTERRNSALQMV